MNKVPVIVSLLTYSFIIITVHSTAQPVAARTHIIHPLRLQDVDIKDSFWSPKLKVWSSKTVYDVFDKLEGRYEPDRQDIIEEKAKLGRTRNAFMNFDRVAEGKTDH